MPEYKWPAKISRYGIECPFLRILVAKYESAIPWNQNHITTPEDLVTHVKEVMLPQLSQRISPESIKNQYCQPSALARLNMERIGDGHWVADIFRRHGEAYGGRYVLDKINRDKHQRFTEWWNYVTVENPAYRDNYAFQYLILKPIIDSSPAKTTRQALPLNAEALASIYDAVRTGTLQPSINLLKEMTKRTAYGSGSRPDSAREYSGWLTINKRMDQAAQRLAAVAQGAGWCIASSTMAQRYLNSSIFSILIIDGRPVAAIRWQDSAAVEIQGRLNQDPGQYWSQIMLFCKARHLMICSRFDEYRRQSDQHRKRLRQSIEYSECTINPLIENPALALFCHPAKPQEACLESALANAWMNCFRLDPMAARLMPEWIPLGPRDLSTYRDAWLEYLEHEPRAIVRMPLDFQPCSPFSNQFADCWAVALKSNPDYSKQCPAPFFQHANVVEGLVNGWASRIFHRINNWPLVPDWIAETPQLQRARRLGWIKELKRAASAWERCPEDLRNNPGFTARRYLFWEYALRKNPASIIDCPVDALHNPRVQRARIQGWASRLSRCPTSELIRCPAELRHQPKIASVLKRRLQSILKHSPEEWALLPADIPLDEFVISAWQDGWQTTIRSTPPPKQERVGKPSRFAKLLMRFVDDSCRLQAAIQDRSGSQIELFSKNTGDALQSYWIEGWAFKIIQDPMNLGNCPAELHELEIIRKAQTKGWKLALKNRKREWDICPSSLQEDRSIISAQRKHWVQILAADPRQYENCPAEFKEDPRILSALEQGRQRQAEKREEERIFWSKPTNTRDMSWREWMDCPEFLRHDPAIIRRALVPITQALRRGAAVWNDIQHPWRDMPELQQEAAACWAASRLLQVADAPTDIRELVESFAA